MRICARCNGKGLINCPRCEGRGTEGDGQLELLAAPGAAPKCPRCQGAGTVVCPACEGSGTVEDEDD
jgi:DnaJ-class molecular chaperone